jgi:hypothetical protein
MAPGLWIVVGTIGHFVGAQQRCAPVSFVTGSAQS